MGKQQTTKVPDAVERWLDYMFDTLFNNTEREVNDMEETDSGYPEAL